MEIGKDIISLLVKRHMNLIAESILSFLDDTSLKNCEAVSKTWYLTIRNGKLWKHLFNRISQRKPLLQTLLKRRELEAKHDMEKDEFLYKRLLNCQHSLSQNWTSGKYSLSSANVGEVSVSIVVMDAKRILFALRTSPSVPSSIMVWNRWTLESEQYLVGHQEWVTDLQICGELIFCSYYDGTILVWDLKTKEVVQQFQDQEVVDWVVIHAAHQLLITCTSIASGPSDRDTSITVRRIKSPAEMVIEATEEIPNYKVCRLVSDENYFAVFLSSSGGDWIKLQLRSAADFRCVREMNNLIQVEDSFDYHSGRLVTGSSEGVIKIWNPETGVCRQTWKSTETIDQLRLSSQHIIARHSEDTKFFVWNLPTAADLMERQEPNDPVQIETCEEVGVMDPSFIFDELQIINVSVNELELGIPNTSVSSSTLVVRDFLKQ
jgi:WD40 repeat protein